MNCIIKSIKVTLYTEHKSVVKYKTFGALRYDSMTSMCRKIKARNQSCHHYVIICSRCLL